MNKFEGVSYLGSAVALISGLNLSDWAAIFGILFGFCTLLITWHYKQKEYELRRLELNVRLAEAESKAESVKC
ncbi:hypothetical protein JP28_09425 [Gallibacterium anatis]|uniref:HP1 family phage holin n=1 Tax=Gallibacterium anatis TaxID=750 RepID=UPI000531C051|nr:HP1 family phage holin [Gallibacterium anatis]KGQ43219.1 hypothetical protein JP28_09425 [Gallibacterium anatis]KGQ48821.1 hypothetical protein IO46_11505 [Gallibacterium anatis]KGQ55807.1 hypothetical protein IO45_12220 [Gallibacterium anatis]